MTVDRAIGRGLSLDNQSVASALPFGGADSFINIVAAVDYYGLVNPAHKQFLQPHEQQFWYAPWNPNYDGTTSLEWVLFGPWGELGDEFELIARCGENACQTHWRYKLEAKE